ncbi:hypothetical protein ES702_07785 [subsurface metagenome]
MKLIAFVLVAVIFFLTVPAFGLNIVTKEIKFKDDPVLIQSTWAHFKEESYGKELYCWIEYKNQSDKAINALSFRMLFYDVFNEYLDTLSGVSMDRLRPAQLDKGKWKSNVYKDWSTHTIIVFLDRVRFADGTIWRRDELHITKELSEVKDILFNPEQLKEKRKK